jgi:hypothetical protein
VGPRAGLDDVEKRRDLTLPGLELQPVASRYTDYVTRTPYLFTYPWKIILMSAMSVISVQEIHEIPDRL